MSGQALGSQRAAPLGEARLPDRETLHLRDCFHVESLSRVMSSQLRSALGEEGGLAPALCTKR